MSGDEVASSEFRRVSPKAVVAVIAVVVIIAAAAVGVWQAIAWEATPEPTSSIGTSGALRGWLALVAISVTAVATAFLAWFARRVPEGVSGLLKRLDDAEDARRRAEEARQEIEADRDTLAARLSRPYLHSEALAATEEEQYARVQVVSRPAGRIAPTLSISLPMGRLPQAFVIDKEECRKWFAEIELAESKDGENAVLRYSNVALVATVNPPHDDKTGPSLVLFPNTTPAVPQVAVGLLHSWSEFREAVRQVATHRLPSRTEYMQRRAKEH